MCAPKEPAQVLDYMPNHRDRPQHEPELSEEELERLSDYNLRVAELAATLKAQAHG